MSGQESLRQATLTIESICRKIMKQEVLDVFYIIQENPDISKKSIGDIFIEHATDAGTTNTQRYRPLINECIAKLEGATFVEYFKEGVSHMYSLTEAGKIAFRILANLFEEDPSIVKGTKYVKKLMS